jgi:hypothetical protein
MDESDERVLAAVLIELYFAANLIIGAILPSLFGMFLSTLGYETGFWYGIDWFNVAPKIYTIWTYCILLLPFYAIIQAAPSGAFDFIFKRSDH